MRYILYLLYISEILNITRYADDIASMAASKEHKGKNINKKDIIKVT